MRRRIHVCHVRRRIHLSMMKGNRYMYLYLSIYLSTGVKRILSAI